MKPWRPLAAGSAVVALALLGWAVFVEPGRVRVRTIELSLPGWPLALDGLRVAAMGDIHAGAPHVGVDRLRALVADVNRASPGYRRASRRLRDPRRRGGQVRRAGDHGGGPRRLARSRRRRGRARQSRLVVRRRSSPERSGSPRIVVLENDAHRVVHEGSTFWLAGLADLWTRRPDIEGTLAGIPPGAPVLLLTHSPDVFPKVPARVAVTLAAHTHGGQVRLPPFPAPLVPSRYGSRYAGGHVIEGGRHLFVTTGVGTSILPVRFGVPPEVVILALHPVPPAR